MASREQNSYEGSLSVYKINLRLVQTKLTIGAEHRHTKKIYRTEIDQNDISNITQGICETCEQLFELLQELTENDGKDKNKNLEAIEQETKLILNLTLIMAFGRTSRQFNMKFELESVQLDDLTRLENIINEHAQRLEQLEWTMNDRFDHATKLISLYEDQFQFRNLSPNDTFDLSNDGRTISCKTEITYTSKSHFVNQPTVFGAIAATSTPVTTSKETMAITNQAFVCSTNKRYQLIRFNLHRSDSPTINRILIGVVYQPNTKEYSKIVSSVDAWLLNGFDGSIQHSNFGSRPYTWSLYTSIQQTEPQHNATAHVDLLLIHTNVV